MLRSFSAQDEEMKDESEAVDSLRQQCSFVVAIFKLLEKLQSEDTTFGKNVASLSEIEQMERQIIYRSDSLLKLCESIELAFADAPLSSNDFTLRRIE